MSKGTVLTTRRAPKGPFHCSSCLRAHASLLIHSPNLVAYMLGSLLLGSGRERERERERGRERETTKTPSNRTAQK